MLGSPTVLGPKLFWDDILYWIFVCRYFFNRLYRLSDAEHARFDAIGEEVAVRVSPLVPRRYRGTR